MYVYLAVLQNNNPTQMQTNSKFDKEDKRKKYYEKASKKSITLGPKAEETTILPELLLGECIVPV